ncbi:MAG: hypothetical protein SFV54_08195 [Bryobacteraceae bacterium]|nr:hypothetical protein [Bryobacteraceae bacterium]
MNRSSVAALAIALSAVAGAQAQTIVSARSGLVHYVEGEAFLDDKVIDPKPGEFPQIKEKSLFRTGEGRAEILLNTGVVLRLGEESSIRMLSSRLTDTRLEVLSGSALIEAAEILEGNSVVLIAGQSEVALRKRGLYRIDFNPVRLRVYDGEAGVNLAGQVVLVKDSRTMNLDGADAIVAKFDDKMTDSLYRWGKSRAGYIAMANAASARQISSAGSSWRSSGWQWNPFYGMFTFIPGNGIISSPFGWRYFSPDAIWAYYNPPTYAGSGGGFGGGAWASGASGGGGGYVGPRGGGYSGSSGSSGGGYAASSGASSGAVGGGDSGGRSGGGGGRGSSAGGGAGR